MNKDETNKQNGSDSEIIQLDYLTNRGIYGKLLSRWRCDLSKRELFIYLMKLN
jgi:hypothetical protein